MMRIVETDEHYRRIVAAAEKDALYRELLSDPWAGMMRMVTQQDDSLAGARAWGWLLPEHLQTTPRALTQLEEADAWQTMHDALRYGISRFAELPFEHVEGWLILTDPARADPSQQGYAGAVDWMQPRFMLTYSLPDERNLRSLPGATVHELHHLIRLHAFPWDMQHTTVADYIIHEGLAESFATACFGESVLGHYVTELDAAGVEAARSVIGAGLHRTGFDVIRAYIFGDHWARKLGLPEAGVPTYGGYATGYHVVQAFLERTGTTIEEATFLPAMEIVAGSGTFEG